MTSFLEQRDLAISELMNSSDFPSYKMTHKKIKQEEQQ